MSHTHDCSRCGWCVELCPMNWREEKSSPMDVCMLARYDKAKADKIVEVSKVCNTCGLCGVVCPQGIPVDKKIIEYREEYPLEIEFCEGNFPEKNADVLFFTGCYGNKPEFSDIIKQSVEFIERSGVKVDVCDEVCCGAPLLYSGNKKKLKEYAQNIFTKLRKYKKIITFCPVCQHFLYDLYYDIFFLTLEDVDSLLQYVLLKNKRLATEDNDFLFFPCRPVNFSDNPLMSNIKKYIDPNKLKNSNILFSGQAICCGNSDFTDKSENIRWPVNNWIKETIKRVIAFCPHCYNSLKGNQEKREVVHFANIINTDDLSVNSDKSSRVECPGTDS